MIILKYADTYPLVGRNLTELTDVDIVQILHANRLFPSLVIGLSSHLDGDIQIAEFLDGFIAQATSFLPPELDADRQLVQVIAAGRLGKRGKQELHVRLPGMSFRKIDLMTCTHGPCVAVDASELHTVHATDHLAPCIGIDDLIEPEAFLRFTQERTGHTLAFDVDSGLIIKIVKLVVVETKFSVSYPDIGRLPVENGIGIEDIDADLGGPAIGVVHLILAGQVNATPTAETFLCANADHVTGTRSLFPFMKPLGKVHLKLIVPHILIIELEIFLVIATRRLLTHPQIFHLIVPGTPEGLIHRRTGGNLDRDTDAVNIQNVLVGLQHAIHIIDGHRILNLVVDMEYTELSLQIVPTNIVDTKVEQDTTVLSTRKRHTDVVKILKDNLQAFLCQFIYVFSTCTTSHTPSVLSVLYHFHIALPHIHFLESQSTKDIPILQKTDGHQRAPLFCRNSHDPLQQSFQHSFVTSLDIVIVHNPTALPTLYRNKADHFFPIHSDKPTVSLSGAEREIIVLLQDSRIHYQRTDTWIQCCIQSFKFQYLIHKKLLIYS